MENKRKLLWRAVIIPALLLLSSVAQGQSGANLPGQDYKSFDLPQANPDVCEKACSDDPSCKAWTYVRPGFQGPNARCWLKSGVPRAEKNECCTSGVKRTTVSDTTMQTVTSTVMNTGKVMAATGCIDWNQPPPGIVFGLKHSTNQADKYLIWNGEIYDPVTSVTKSSYPLQRGSGGSGRPQSPSASQGAKSSTSATAVEGSAQPQYPPALLTIQNGGDLGGSTGEGFYWYETSGAGFPWPNTAQKTPKEIAAWQAFVSKLPPGLVFGLKHSVNQSGKTLPWLSEPKDFVPWQFTNLDPVNNNLIVPWPFGRQNGGDRGASSGQGFYWYEVLPNAQPSPCEASLPGGLIFGLKHSMNQPNKKFYWHGVVYDAAQPGGPQPSGFVRCHGGDKGAPSGQGYYWFETIGHGSSVQNRLGVSCEGNYRIP